MELFEKYLNEAETVTIKTAIHQLVTEYNNKCKELEDRQNWLDLAETEIDYFLKHIYLLQNLLQDITSRQSLNEYTLRHKEKEFKKLMRKWENERPDHFRVVRIR
jgi:hypothetical protein